ncbi:hypothetical protein V8C86DRAFT_2528657 [Haematococcus lacustris]
MAATEQTFTMKCAGCHAGGGNVLAAGASLFPDDLKRNGYTDAQSLYTLIYKGKFDVKQVCLAFVALCNQGKMPGYGKECAPKGQCTFGPRLADEEVQSLAEYVLERAAAGWAK